tara:strand:+ start:220 stop:621 length:402 start_codon:yes stop_codon:yes gene_type:complete
MEEPFSNDRSWHITKNKAKCPMTQHSGQYFNKAAFTSVDKENFGSSISGSGGSDHNNSLTERGFAQFRMPIRGHGDMMSGVERFDNSDRAQSGFQRPTSASLVSMNKGNFISGQTMNISDGQDPTGYLSNDTY